MQLKICIMCITCLLAFSFSDIQAQENEADTTTVISQDTIQFNNQLPIDSVADVSTAPDSVGGIFNSQKNSKIPRKAALYAAVLPGLGQIYNGSAWKVPIVYGTFITLGWIANFHNDRYQLFRRANIALDNNLPEQNPLDGTVFTATSIAANVDNTHRDRDFTYILIAGAYALQIMEAIVDAHLIEFDVSEDLSMEFQPSVGQFLSYGSSTSFVPAMGLSFILKIQ